MVLPPYSLLSPPSTNYTMTKRDASYINHIYTILAERDLIRRYLSSPPTQSLPPTPALLAYLVTNITTAHQFYSIYRSKACIESNRYPADIFAYDRTSVKLRYGDKGGKEGGGEAEEGEYLNANVVRGEGETAWWVASQVSEERTEVFSREYSELFFCERSEHSFLPEQNEH